MINGKYMFLTENCIIFLLQMLFTIQFSVF